MAQYRVKSGIDYLGKRAEVGDIVTDLPPKAIKWLRECDAIELLGDAIDEPEADIEETVEVAE